MAIQLIESISYAPIGTIKSYAREPGNKVRVSVEEWKPVPMTPASGEMNYDSKEVDAALFFSTEVQARLKEPIPNIPDSIFKILLCNGRELIIGSPFLPVRPLLSKTLSLSRFEIEYSNINEPSELIP